MKELLCGIVSLGEWHGLHSTCVYSSTHFFPTTDSVVTLVMNIKSLFRMSCWEVTGNTTTDLHVHVHVRKWKGMDPPPKKEIQIVWSVHVHIQYLQLPVHVHVVSHVIPIFTDIHCSTHVHYTLAYGLAHIVYIAIHNCNVSILEYQHKPMYIYTYYVHVHTCTCNKHAYMHNT